MTLRSVSTLIILMAAAVAGSGLRPRKQSRDLVVGGTGVTDDTFEWYAYVENSGVFCGGALVGGAFDSSSDRILTSWTCIENVFGGASGVVGKAVTVGARDGVAGEKGFVEAILIASNFDDTSSSVPRYDMALLKLTTFIPITPLQLAGAPMSVLDKFDTATFTFLGFGATTTPGGTVPADNLQRLDVDFVQFSTCNSGMNYNGALLNDTVHFCFGGVMNEGACDSDEGGIVVGFDIASFNPFRNRWSAVGIYSHPFPADCGTTTLPAVFTAVSAIVQDIENIFTNSPTKFPTQAPVSGPLPTTPAPVDPDPTPAPTPAPAPTGGGGCGFCFSESATVQVLETETTTRSVAMKDLQIGQQVYAGHDEDNKPIYETVYGFAHREVDRYAEYLRIKTACHDKRKCDKDLEISPYHLIFKEGQKDPVAAGSLAVGDVLLRQSVDDTEPHRATITAIKTIVERGTYAPLTKDGTVIVNGIHASSYVSIQPMAPRVIETVTQFMSEQAFFHWWMAPYRLVCTRVAPQLCENDYDEADGYIHWLVFGRLVAERFEACSKFTVSAWLLFMVVVSGVFVVAEDMLARPFVWLVQLGCGYFIWRRLCSMQKKVSSLKSKTRKTD